MCVCVCVCVYKLVAWNNFGRPLTNSGKTCGSLEPIIILSLCIVHVCEFKADVCNYTLSTQQFVVLKEGKCA